MKGKGGLQIEKGRPIYNGVVLWGGWSTRKDHPAGGNDERTANKHVLEEFEGTLPELELGGGFQPSAFGSTGGKTKKRAQERGKESPNGGGKRWG